MLSYTFSNREKVLLVILALVVVAIAWFMLVFQRTNNEITELESAIADVQTQTSIASSQVSQLNMMKEEIEEKKASGIAPVKVPSYDNRTALMASLNTVLANASTYSVSFDQIDTETMTGYVLRGAKIDFGCDSYDQAKSIISSLANSTFPCSVNSVTVADGAAQSSRASTGSSSSVAVSLQITYYEALQR